MKENKQRIFAVVIHYKSYEALEKTLYSLSDLLIPPGYILTIVVVDQEYNPKNLQKMQRKFPKCIYIKEKNNLGVGGAFNLGFQYGYERRGKYFFMMPADMTMEKNILTKLLRAINSDKTIGMVCPKILLNTKPKKILFVGGKLDPKVKSSIHIGFNEIDRSQYDYKHETELLNCPVLIKRTIFDRVGYMNPEYFMYYEDTDWQTRVRRKGYKLYVVPEAVAFTDEASSNKQSVNKKNYYITRNLLFFLKNNFTFQDQFIAYIFILKETLSLLVDLLIAQKKERAYYKLLGVRDFILNRKGMRQLYL